MKSSRSRRSELNALTDAEEQLNYQEIPKNHGFAGFFGRSKHSRGKMPAPLLVSQPLPTIDNSLLEPPTPDAVENTSFLNGERSSALHVGHYRTLSRSMNDIGSVALRGDFFEARYGSATENLRSASDLKYSSSNTSLNSGLERHISPFPSESITKQGWVNRKGSKHSSNWKLHSIYV